MIGNYNYGTGRRKSSVARVFIKAGSGKIVVNDKPVDEYFSRETGRMIVRQPLALTDNLSRFDIMVNVSGGGESGQAGAVRHGITRALIDLDAEMKPALKAAGIDYLAYVYKGAQHAFYNDTNAARYDKAAADLSWERTLALFRQTL